MITIQQEFIETVGLNRNQGSLCLIVNNDTDDCHIETRYQHVQFEEVVEVIEYDSEGIAVQHVQRTTTELTTGEGPSSKAKRRSSKKRRKKKGRRPKRSKSPFRPLEANALETPPKPKKVLLFGSRFLH